MVRGEGRQERAGPGEGGDGADQPRVGEVWSRVKRRLRAELGEDVFTSWFARLEVDGVFDGCAHLTVPTRFLKSWIEAHYLDRVLATYRSESDAVERISIGVRGSVPRDAVALRRIGDPARLSAAASDAVRVHPDERDAAPAPGPRREERGEASGLGGAPLDGRLTFESFIVGRSNALAHAAADRVAHTQNGQAIYNPLYLHAGWAWARPTSSTPSGTRCARRGAG
jgi:chromosomal replication initiator protein